MVTGAKSTISNILHALSRLRWNRGAIPASSPLAKDAGLRCRSTVDLRCVAAFAGLSCRTFVTRESCLHVRAGQTIPSVCASTPRIRSGAGSTMPPAAWYTHLVRFTAGASGPTLPVGTWTFGLT